MTKRQIAQIKKSLNAAAKSKKSSTQQLQRIGILTQRGKLSKKYGG